MCSSVDLNRRSLNIKTKEVRRNRFQSGDVSRLQKLRSCRSPVLPTCSLRCRQWPVLLPPVVRTSRSRVDTPSTQYAYKHYAHHLSMRKTIALKWKHDGSIVALSRNEVRHKKEEPPKPEPAPAEPVGPVDAGQVVEGKFGESWHEATVVTEGRLQLKRGLFWTDIIQNFTKWSNSGLHGLSLRRFGAKLRCASFLFRKNQ